MQKSKEINRMFLQKSKEINLNIVSQIAVRARSRHESTLQNVPAMTSDDTL